MRYQCYLFLACLLALARFASAQDCTIQVNQFAPDPTNGIYPTITEALSNVLPNGNFTICVHPGTYAESISLAPTNSTITVRSLRGPEVTKLVPRVGSTSPGVTLAGTAPARVIGFTVQGFRSDGVQITSTSKGTLLANCVVRGNQYAGIAVYSGASSGVQVLNNTIASNGTYGFYMDVSYSLVSFNNNILFQNELYEGYYTGAGSIRIGNYNTWFDSRTTERTYYIVLGANDLTTNPNLDPNNNFRFTGSSPAVGSGDTEILDPDGTRSDRGAYGGPYAAAWFRSTIGGPVIENITVDPPQVRPGDEQTITIRATARTD